MPESIQLIKANFVLNTKLMGVFMTISTNRRVEDKLLWRGGLKSVPLFLAL